MPAVGEAGTEGTGAQTVRAEGQEPGPEDGRNGPKETKGRRAEGGNMKKPNREGWALYGTPEVGDDACQFWPEAGTGGLDLPSEGRCAEDGSV